LRKEKCSISVSKLYFSKQVVGYSLLLIFVILAAGLLFVSYAATLAVLLGVALGVLLGVLLGLSFWFLNELVRNLDWRQQVLRKKVLIWLLVLLGFAFLTAYVVYLVPEFSLLLRGKPTISATQDSRDQGVAEDSDLPEAYAQVHDYKVLVRSPDPAESDQQLKFVQTMQVDFEDPRAPNTDYVPLTFVKEEDETEASSKKSLLLREASISPQGKYTLSSDQEGNSSNIFPVDSLSVTKRSTWVYTESPALHVQVTCSGGDCTPSDAASQEGKVSASLCSGDACPPSEVELRDFPEGSFLGADNKEEDPDYGDPYLGTVDITWPVADPRQSIVFAYIPKPYYRLPLLREVPEYFAGIGSSGEAFFALLGGVWGVLGGLVVFGTGVIGGVLSDVAKDKIRTRLEKIRGAREQKPQESEVDDKEQPPN